MRYEEALRIAEERDAQLRAQFTRFDVDSSGTIDMEELLALMDELGLVAGLKCDPVDFAKEMFEKYDANHDGVLDYEEFKRFHNAAKDNAAGRQNVRKSTISRTASGLDQKMLDARKAAAEEKARQKAEEAERIRRENAALKARIAAQCQAGGRDMKALDAEYEAKRRELAEKRARDKAEAQARLDAQNSYLRQRLDSTRAATVNKLSDEQEAKRAQAEQVRLDRAQRATEEASEHARTLGERVSSVGAATVNKLSADEEHARTEKARQMADAREAEFARKEQENREMKAKLDSVGA